MVTEGTKDVSQAQIRTDLNKNDKLLLVNSETKEVMQIPVGNLPTGSPDEEDITTHQENDFNVLRFKDRPAVLTTGGGNGYVILRKKKIIRKYRITCTNPTTAVTVDSDVTFIINNVRYAIPFAVGKNFSQVISTFKDKLPAFVGVNSNLWNIIEIWVDDDATSVTFENNTALAIIRDASRSESIGFLEKDLAANTIYELRYHFDLKNIAINVPAGVIFKFNGGTLLNHAFAGSNFSIDTEYNAFKSSSVNMGQVKPSNRIFYYNTVQEAKNDIHWVGKRIKVNGFWFVGDGGAAEYLIRNRDDLRAENQYFNGCWEQLYNGSYLSGGAGLFVDFGGNWGELVINNKSEIHLACFGVKFDAKFFNGADKKYYSDSLFTTLATDNYACIFGAIRQMQYYGLGKLPRRLVFNDILITNSTITLTHGNYRFTLQTPSSPVDRSNSAENGAGIITSNVALDVLIQNYYSAAEPTRLTANFMNLKDIYFLGHNRVKYGLILKNGYEIDSISNLQCHDFIENGAVMWGLSSTFKIDNASFFRCKSGLKITNLHPILRDGNNQPLVSVSDGIHTYNNIQGDDNTKALIEIDTAAVGASIFFNSIKSERNPATILLTRATPQIFIGVYNAFANNELPNDPNWYDGKSSFLTIENYVGDLPTFFLNGIYSNNQFGGNNTGDRNNYLIWDKKNNKNIRFAINPTASFPVVLYTNNVGSFQNGYAMYRDGNPSELSINKTSGASNARPSNSNTYGGLPIGFRYFETDTKKTVSWGGVNWHYSDGSIAN
ncbi:hypothetical protein [Sphingobacterium multivorum]|uniref:hypothetical protein n=1 Tax=Sphingobacterium multivorum TaxID=28454 RepID=UPI003DA3CFA9